MLFIFLCVIYIFSKQNAGWSPYSFFFEVLVHSENMAYLNDSWIVTSWLGRYKSVDISNDSFSMITCCCKIHFYVDYIKFVELFFVDSYMLFIFSILKFKLPMHVRTYTSLGLFVNKYIVHETYRSYITIDVFFNLYKK